MWSTSTERGANAVDAADRESEVDNVPIRRKLHVGEDLPGRRQIGVSQSIRAVLAPWEGIRSIVPCTGWDRWMTSPSLRAVMAISCGP